MSSSTASITDVVPSSASSLSSSSFSSSSFLRGSLPSFPQPGSEEHDRLLQYDLSRLTGDCQLLDVVDACRGTGVARDYIGVFQPYKGSCDGDFVDGLPIYFNENKLLYMYPIDIYPDHWSVRALRGLVRWRIAKFKTFEDKESCRREEANIFQIDFAADGQPYNYHPTISCFDEFANDFSGFKVSTITIVCKDIVVESPNKGSSDDGKGGGLINGGGFVNNNGDGDGTSLGLIIGIAAVAVLVAIGAFLYFRKRNQNGTAGGDMSEKKRKKAAEKKAKEDAKKKAAEEAAAARKKKVQEESAPPKKSWEKTSDTTQDTAKTRESNKDEPPRIIPVPNQNRPEKHQPYNLQRKMSKDPPARIGEDNAIPGDIQRMVADIENSFDSEIKGSGGKTNTPPTKHSPTRGRSRSLEPSQSSKYADEIKKDNNNQRSHSLERAKATARDYFDRSAGAMANAYDGLKKGVKSLHEKKETPDGVSVDSINSSLSDGDFAEDNTPPKFEDRGRSRGRSRSIERGLSNRERGDRSVERATSAGFLRDRARSRSAERSRANDHATRDRGRSESKERSRADDYDTNRRGRSKERSGATDNYNSYLNSNRSKSKEQSGGAEDYANRGRSRSKEQTGADDYANRGRSRSKERARADDYANRGRSRSKERSSAADYLRDRARSRSAERGRANDYASRDRGRSRSKERARADDYASRGRDRSRSIERHRPRSLERSRANSLERSRANREPSPDRQRESATGRGTDGFRVPGSPSDDGPIGRSKAGKGALDASKHNKTITKNPDGSVLVSQRRRREDGAIVTTKTKYANIALARKHGVDV